VTHLSHSLSRHKSQTDCERADSWPSLYVAVAEFVVEYDHSEYLAAAAAAAAADVDFGFGCDFDLKRCNDDRLLIDIVDLTNSCSANSHLHRRCSSRTNLYEEQHRPSKGLMAAFDKRVHVFADEIAAVAVVAATAADEYYDYLNGYCDDDDAEAD
jgi:hypothetical protein